DLAGEAGLVDRPLYLARFLRILDESHDVLSGGRPVLRQRERELQTRERVVEQARARQRLRPRAQDEAVLRVAVGLSVAHQPERFVLVVRRDDFGVLERALENYGRR